MTKEETIKLVKEVTGMSLDWDDAHYEALQMAIGALEREPCDDAISRKWVLDVVNNFVFDTETDRNRIIHIVRDTAPSVMPKEKQEPILDKIRAEIESKCCITVGRENDPAITLYDVFEIIDKYKTESEVQE